MLRKLRIAQLVPLFECDDVLWKCDSLWTLKLQCHSGGNMRGLNYSNLGWTKYDAAIVTQHLRILTCCAYTMQKWQCNLGPTVYIIFIWEGNFIFDTWVNCFGRDMSFCRQKHQECWERLVCLKKSFIFFSVVLFFFLAFAEATQVRRSCRDCGVGTVTFPLDSPLLLLQPTTVKRPRPSVSDEDGGSPLKRCSLAATPLKTEDWQTLGSTSWKTRCALYFLLLPKVVPFSHELGKNFGGCSSVCMLRLNAP